MISPVSSSAAAALSGIAMNPARGSAQESAGTPQGADFTSLLKSFATNAADTVKQGEAAAIAGIQGNLPLQTVVEQVLAAERTLQASIAVRDKLVSSYLEISRMQI